MEKENYLSSDINRTPCTVLLIEDDVDIRTSLASALELEGFVVRCAENGREGINLLLLLAEPPQIILLDIMMPVMDGWEFLREFRKHPTISNIPVYVMSAIKDLQLKEPANGLLSKPVELDYLINLIQRYCKRQ